MTSHFDHRPPRVVVFSGNMHRPSRSRALGERLAEGLRSAMPVDVEVLDLVDAGPGLGAAFTRDALDDAARHLVESIESADGLIAVTPVYKGSFTGLFKHALDFVEPLALAEKPVLIASVGGGHRHALIVEHQLRPLFGSFSALTVPTAVYASEHEIVDGAISDPALEARIEQAARQMAVLLEARRNATAAARFVPN